MAYFMTNFTEKGFDFEAELESSFPIKNKKKKTIPIPKQDPKKDLPYTPPTEIRAGGEITYKMPLAIYKQIIKKKNGKIGDIQKTLCDYVNSQYGFLGSCVTVIVE